MKILIKSVLKRHLPPRTLQKLNNERTANGIQPSGPVNFLSIQLLIGGRRPFYGVMFCVMIYQNLHWSKFTEVSTHLVSAFCRICIDLSSQQIFQHIWCQHSKCLWSVWFQLQIHTCTIRLNNIGRDGQPSIYLYELHWMLSNLSCDKIEDCNL
jgi:hypothetical protein